jgi:hypothetical protein
MRGKKPMGGSKSNRAMRLWAAVAFLFTLGLAPVVAIADPYEPDDTAATAKRVLINDPARQHDFGKRGDLDWIYFFACADTSYSITAANVASNCDIKFTLFAADGRTTVTPPGEIDWNGPGESETIMVSRLPAGFYYVRFRDCNPNVYGPAVTYWASVNEITGGGIPIETVDEKTIGIRPSSFGGAGGRTAMADLTPWNRGNRPPYTKHRIEFPGYDKTTTGTAIDVSICWARQEEKFDRPGQVFPSKSAALFVIKTVQWSGGKSVPVAFTQPVNIAVEFAPDSSSVWNDIVTFQNEAGAPDKMWIVRDMIDGSGVNFQFLPGVPEVNVAERTVTIRNYRNLTGNSGQAAYGAVANPNASRTGVHHWSLYE